MQVWDLIASMCVPTEVDLVYRDVDGGVTLFNAENLTTRILMTNSTFVSKFHILIFFNES
jgi:fructose-1,6-bisphosphatase/inositol monophosphatase family enzyme